jgi:AraC-like DNA-binding protein
MNGRLTRIEDWEKLAQEAHFKAAEVSALCFVSSRQLERYFKDHFNATPRQWLSEVQCSMALKLIGQGCSNKAVAADLQFTSPSQFCRKFKRQFGKPPQAFGPIWTNELKKMSHIANNVAF